MMFANSTLLTQRDLKWLQRCFPELTYRAGPEESIEGQLQICAAYDKIHKKLRFDLGARTINTYLCDEFKILILLNSTTIKENGWPIVYETGKRHVCIAKKNGVRSIELHIDRDGKCCLGIRYTREKNLSLDRFFYRLVIPFFYRLSYTDKFGLTATKSDLWGEYSHGEEGYREYKSMMSEFAKLNLTDDARCPCGSEEKFMDCCLHEVKYVERLQSTSTE